QAVVATACDELGRALPLQPLLDIVDQLVRRWGAEDVLGPDTAVLGPLLGVHPASEPGPQLVALTGPGTGEALIFGALFSVLRRRADHEPIIVVIDDVHLAGSATTTWLAQSVRRLADARVLIVATRREEEAQPIPGVRRIALGPLDLQAAAEIVGDARAAELHARSGGHPLFLVELAAADPLDGLPASIRQAVEDRCARAGPAAATLRAAAVLGTASDLDLLAEVTGEGAAALLDHLDEGVRRRLLVDDGTGLAFAHGLIRDALAATVSATRSAYIHRQAGRALANRTDPDPLAVALHARLGGDRPLASRMLVVAARAAVARMSQAEAVGLLDEAVALDDTVEARLERARVLSMVLRYDECLADVESARARGAGPEALEIAAWAAHFQRHADRALLLADRGAREATDSDVRASCLALAGWVSLTAGDLHGAAQRLTGAVAEGGTGVGDRLSEVWLGWLRMNQGRPDETIRLARLPTPGDPPGYRFPNAYALMATTMAFAMLGRPDEALTSLAALDDAVARTASQRWTARPLNLRGWILRNLGAGDEADDLNAQAIEAAGAIDLAEPAANGLLDLAAGRLLAGDLDGTAGLLDRADAVSEVEHAFRWRHRLRSRLMRARVSLAAGDAQAAAVGAEALVADAGALGSARVEVQARMVGYLARRRLGEPVDLADADRDLERLGGVAGIEAWWITAEMGRQFDVDRWSALARRRAADLVARAGTYAPTLERAAAKLLD
ncbi:MAG TPA: hypothetical protein VGI06_01135, partial [Acidimicrobiales bacterium]